MFIQDFYNKYFAWHYKGTVNRSGFLLFGIAATIFSNVAMSMNQSYPLFSWLLLIFIIYIYGGLVVRRVRDIGWPIYISLFAILGLLSSYISGVIVILLILFPSKKIEKK